MSRQNKTSGIVATAESEEIEHYSPIIEQNSGQIAQILHKIEHNPFFMVIFASANNHDKTCKPKCLES